MHKTLKQGAISTGQRSFGTDARGTIYYKNDGSVVPKGMTGALVLQ